MPIDHAEGVVPSGMIDINGVRHPVAKRQQQDRTPFYFFSKSNGRSAHAVGMSLPLLCRVP